MVVAQGSDVSFQTVQTVAECLETMQERTRRGDFAGATAVGNRLPVPLAISKEDLVMGAKISDGACSTVFAATFRGQPVAVKKAHIRRSADLLRFRKEVTMLSALSHRSITPLLAARALPPDYLLVMPLFSSSLEVRPRAHGPRVCSWFTA